METDTHSSPVSPYVSLLDNAMILLQWHHESLGRLTATSAYSRRNPEILLERRMMPQTIRLHAFTRHSALRTKGIILSYRNDFSLTRVADGFFPGRPKP